MNVALTRTATGFRFQFQRTRDAVPPRNLGELASKCIIVTLFSFMAASMARNAAETGHVTGILLVVSEALVVALTVIRRPTGIVDRTMWARVLTMTSTFGPPLVRPDDVGALAPELATITLAAAGLMIVVLGKVSLGRSFGLTPANRGIVCRGMYRLVRHPIYLGYLITHLGFVLANPSGWNIALLLAADIALMLRAVCEEKTLRLDQEYRSYMDRVRWRIVPGVF